VTAAEVTQSAGRSRLLFRPTVLAVATVILGGFGVFATIAGHSARTAAATANTAVVDRPATASVERAVTSAVNTIFSYSYADVAKTRKAAQTLLTGAAIKQYDQLFALVEQQAPKEKLIVVTKVSTVGVELLTGDRARILVFANQQDTKAGTTQASYSGAMFAVTATNQSGHWQISNINTFTNPS
jgi:Mce-associated membrane protein